MAEESSFGTWLKRRRKALNLTHDELARSLACSRVALYKIEAGERRPSRQLAERMAEHLGVVPAERAAFVEWARAGKQDAQLAARLLAVLPSVEALAGGAQPPTNVPVPSTPLIGRTDDLAMVERRLLQPETRVLTLLGPGGVGKTRLALAVASDLRTWFNDGVFFVDLAPVLDHAAVSSAIAQALDIKVATIGQVSARLHEVLRARQLLLVLDNWEHVLEAAHIVNELVQASPGLKVMNTSRTPLRLRVERRYTVAPLRLPDKAQVEHAELLGRVPAVALFVERAQAVQPGFVLSVANAPAVAALCARVDGLPLAIELVAARSRVLAPHELLARLSDEVPRAFELLRSGARDMPARHQTLQAAIEWSYASLPAAEQQLLVRLGVFVGGWTVAAAEAVCGSQAASPAMGAAPTVLDELEALLDNSLIQSMPGAGDELRFRMLETVREYALLQLERRGELAGIRERHARYYLTVVEAAEPHLTGADQQWWWDRLELDHANLRAAIRWAIDGVHTELAARVVTALRWFWDGRGYVMEARQWLEQVAALPFEVTAQDSAQERSRAALWGKVLHVAGVFAHDQYDHPTATSYYEQSLRLRRQANDVDGIAASLNNLAIIARDEGDSQRAQELLEEVLALRRAQGDKAGISSALLNLGAVAAARGDLVATERLYLESLSLDRDLGALENVAMSLNNLGSVAYERGDYPLAWQRFEESLALRRELNHPRGIAVSQYSLGLVHLQEQQPAQASTCFAESLDVFAKLGERSGIASCLEGFAAVAVCAGKQEDAEAAAKVAARLLGAAAVLRGAIGVPLPAHQQPIFARTIAVAQDAIAPLAWEAAWARGQAMTMDEAVAYARGVVHGATG